MSSWTLALNFLLYKKLKDPWIHRIRNWISLLSNSGRLPDPKTKQSLYYGNQTCDKHTYMFLNAVCIIMDNLPPDTEQKNVLITESFILGGNRNHDLFLA